MKAAANLYISDRDLADWVNDPDVIFKAFSRRQAKLLTVMSDKGLAILDELASNGALPPRVKLDVAKVLLELGGHTPANSAASLADAAAQADLAELPRSELLRRREKARRVIEGTAESVAPHSPPDQPDPDSLL